MPFENTDLLAIEGGNPVRESFLSLAPPSIDGDEIDEVVDTLKSGWLSTGPKTMRFEEEFAKYVGAKYAISVNSCTAGLHLSLVVSGIGAGDEVIVTPLTFCASANVIEHVNARPVFVDIDPSTLNMSPAAIEAAITPRTRGIIAVHYGGLACDMDEIHQICNKHGLTVIEDAAHAISTKYKGRMVGSISPLTSFSFYANKNLTTGEGGMITTDDAGLADKLLVYRLHGLGRDAWQRFTSRRYVPAEVVYAGYKYNMTDIQASLGLHQLRKQESLLVRRYEAAKVYDEAFSTVDYLRTQPHPNDEIDRHAMHLYVLIFDMDQFSVSRNQILEALMAENIGVSLHYRSLHTNPFYRDKYGYKPEDYPVAYRTGEQILSLPMSPRLTIEDARDVVKAVHKVIRHYRTCV
ncbi:MAG: DegT/DnrJ/EryC1/StrS family aminotransferase [Acidobacteria bacterium]|nr:DegT/DnrJ/EryC1/StrS family aminotransferase [Acidobacteriota bacterium]MBI3655411.1 DegT/DnrJ/EryC1/StrS family aminotransferase [Acidobacteriota bacterium]